MKIKEIALLLSLSLGHFFAVLPAESEPRATHWLSVGDSVEVDVIMASSPSSSMWKTGKILEANRSANSYVVEVEGSRRTIINSDNWIKPSANPAPQNNPAQPIATGAGGAGAGYNAPVLSAPNGGAPRANPKFKIGDSVNVDMIMASSPSRAMWTHGKIVGTENGSLIVQTPDGIKRTIVNNPDWIRPGGQAAPGPEAPQNVLQPVPNLTTTNDGPTPAPNNNQQRAQNPVQKPENDPANPEWNRKKGLGAPPDGTYECHKLSGYVMGGGHDIDLGKLEIRGQSYRGIESSGAMSPFTVSGEEITWSNGIDGLPKGWTLKSSKFIGPDEHGRPLIRIYYRAATRGALECIDCYRVR